MYTHAPPLSSASPLQLAVAALFGASVMAISAFYIHKRSVDQVIDRLIDLRRRHPNSQHLSDEEEIESLGFNDSIKSLNVFQHDENVLSSFHDEEDNHSRECKVSSSVPNVSLSKDEWINDAYVAHTRFAVSKSLDKTGSIVSDFPPPRTDQRDREELYVSHCGPILRVGSVGRLVTPRSTGGYAFESTGDSDDERTELSEREDHDLSYENDVHVVAQDPSFVPAQAENGSHSHVLETDVSVAETVTDMDHGAKKVESAPGNILANDSVSGNNFPPLHDSVSIEELEVLKLICECLDLRKKYVFRETLAPWSKNVEKSVSSKVGEKPFDFIPVEATSHHVKMEDGVVHVYASKRDTEELFPVPSSTTFFTDMQFLLKVMSIGNVRSACHHRLRFLEEKFRLHLLVTADREFVAQKSAPHRDFYNIRKVDTHVHHSACMNQKHLLRFIKSKLRKEPDEVVIYRDGQYLTLKEVFDSLDLTGYDLNVDLLDVHADKSTFHRFDKFNLKYNPCGQSRLREIFLKQDNLIQGRFLAEVTKQVLSDLEASKYQLAEYRISIYGRKQSEWDQLASWFVNNCIYSENAVWLIQLPRLYNVYRSMGTVTSFQNILDNIFIPLFEVTVDPNSHPHLHLFLLQVVGFDIVDDESKPERRPTKHMPHPSEWTNGFNPAFSYYAYYCYANLYTLNKLREAKGLPTIRFRPHCGEAGDIDHLAAGFLLCHNISHGINLRKSPVLQYLYYLAQIGLAMSPLSNNSLFLDYHRNPFPIFFQRGLNVSLSTDDPLQIHLTKEPLVEEYSVAAKVWKLSSCDLCEIARNSVYQSGFSHAAKLHWLGDGYFKRGPPGNEIHKTNVPNIRISFRHETWVAEMQYVYGGKARLPMEVEH
ncbi:putative AMP deaminase [Dorcoceras hygrometricum]|uniref:AMP deaminase n=1 Tax=Dorcoceras hygrometricum TaxID=472368 RepID=A0A2Z7BCN9_9LAMI|nr:putative AMP deaminase [Dorcoceras hygrometricum]